MKESKIGPKDMNFRDFSKPWYHLPAGGLCVNAIESLTGEKITDYSCGIEVRDFSKRCIEIGARHNISIKFSGDIGTSCIELQNLINALESQGLFSHSQLEERYYSLLRQHSYK